jgi:hypothetical protein
VGDNFEQKKILAFSSIFLAAVIATAGCASYGHKDSSKGAAERAEIDVEGLFATTRNECIATSNVLLFGSLHGHYNALRLPVSVDRIIDSGELAIPFLKKAAGAADLLDSQLALRCLEMIESPDRTKSAVATDKGSGVKVALYEYFVKH